MYFAAIIELAIVTLWRFQRLVCIVALFDEVHHLAQIDEFIADNLVILFSATRVQ